MQITPHGTLFFLCSSDTNQVRSNELRITEKCFPSGPSRLCREDLANAFSTHSFSGCEFVFIRYRSRFQTVSFFDGTKNRIQYVCVCLHSSLINTTQTIFMQISGLRQMTRGLGYAVHKYRTCETAVRTFFRSGMSDPTQMP